MAREERLTNIPDSQVDRIIENYKRIGVQATKAPQGDGNWTVTAIVPDKNA